MPLLKAFGRSFLRKRHSGGFGVHSPYAYRFVTDVIKSGRYGFYAYDSIDALAHISPRVAHEAKWYVRLLNFLNTRRILMLPLHTREVEVAAEALQIPLKTFRPQDNHDEFIEGDLLILSAGDCHESILRSALKTGISVFALAPEKTLSSFLGMPLPKGVLMRGKKRMLLIPRQEMEYVVYDIEI